MSGWWRDAVMYEVYPRSYCDSDGDGVGDLPGLLSRLDHIARLGVDGIWITPFQTSPQVDNGYDVTDYTGVDPLFGTLHDLDAVIDRAHRLGLRVLADLVPNHCSDQHPLFRAALEAGPGSSERAMFHFRRGPDPQTPPNNWTSVFGGPAWSRADAGSETDADWYLHLFSPAQPDWNWEDPRVGALFEGVLRFWFDRGVDGLRIDVAHALFKAPGLPDAPEAESVVDGLRFNPLACDREPIHDVYRRWRAIAESYEPPRILVGEVNLAPERAARYARPDELNQAFAFAFAALGWDPHEWVRVGRELEQARRTHGAAPTWAIENHDIVRTVTRYGGGPAGARRARAALLALLALPGCAYLFQGQELGLPEVDVPVEARRDPMWSRGGVCRDGARVPLPWTADPAACHHFSTPGATPWLPQPADWGTYAVDAQTGPGSMLTFTREAIALRRRLLAEGVLTDHATQWQVTPTGGLICLRGPLAVIVAMSGPERVPGGEVLISSAELQGGSLPADGAAWVLLEGC